jgi:hypothetical protein
VTEYRPIPDFEGYYEISADGKVRSIERWVKANGGGSKLESPRVLKRSARGSVCLSRDAFGQHIRVWRLVMAAWPEITEFEGRAFKDRRGQLSDEHRAERRKAAVDRFAAKKRMERPPREPKPVVIKAPKRLKKIVQSVDAVLAKPRKPARSMVERHVWTPPKKHPSEFAVRVDQDRIRAFADRGVSIPSIAAAFEISIETVEKMLIEQGREWHAPRADRESAPA